MTMKSLSAISRLFVRHGTKHPEPDEHGFTPLSAEVLTIDVILAFGCVFIRGPQWIGKSHVAKQIELFLRSNHGSDSESAKYIWSSDFEQRTAGTEVLPREWDEWRIESQDAYWIVDALDDGDRREENLSLDIVRKVKSLTVSELARLTIFVFRRANVVPPECPKQFETLFGDEYLDVELLPLDRAAAETMLTPKYCSRVLNLISEKDLRSIAGYPVVLQTLKIDGLNTDAMTTDAVWKRVLIELMVERRASRAKIGMLDTEQLFLATSYLAAAMALSGIDQIGNDSDFSSLPKIASFVASGHRLFAPDYLVHATRTPLFLNGRFVKRNVQEWMAAFALSQLTLNQLRALIIPSEPGRFGPLTGVMALLYQTSKHERVRDWIIEVSGGIPPAADGPFSLAQALLILDKLEEIASATELPISYWRDKGLERLNVPGLVAHASQRMADRTRSDNVRSLLIDICQLNDEAGPADSAFEILVSQDEYVELRHKSLAFKGEFNPQQLQRLLRVVKEASATTDREKALQSRMLLLLLDNHLLTGDECAEYAYQCSGHAIDHTYFLMEKIAKSLTLAGTGIVLRKTLQPWMSSSSEQKVLVRQSVHDDLVCSRAWKETVGRAVELVLSECSPPIAEFEIILNVMFHPRRWDFQRDSGVTLQHLFQRNEFARRRLYVEDLTRITKANGEQRRQYGWLLLADDWQWLQENVEKFAKIDLSVWEDLAQLARRQPAGRKQTLRAFIRDNVPDRLASFDKGVKKYVQQERRHNKQMAALEAEAKARREVHSLPDLVETILTKEGRTERSRWLSLSNVCFYRNHWRGENIVGTWNELDDVTKAQVEIICKKGLVENEPSALPHDRSLPTRVVAEAWCFMHFALDHIDVLDNHPELIERWIPTVFVFPFDERSLVLRNAASVDPSGVERALLHVIRRDLEINSDCAIETRSLCREYWTDNLVDWLLPVLDEEKYTGRARADLLRTLCEHRMERMEPILKKQLDSPESAIRYESIFWHAFIDPHLFLTQIRQESQSAPEVLTLFSRLNSFHESRPFCHEWPSDLLIEMYRLLRTAYPPVVEEEEDEGSTVTGAEEIREFYDSIPRVLAHRVDTDEQSLITKFRIEYPDLHPLFEYESTQARIADAVTCKQYAYLPLVDVIRVLSNPGYRVIRDRDDLLDVVFETLQLIGAQAPEHLEMLYLPDEIHAGSKHRHEGALQSYLVCRLGDILNKYVLHREAQVRFRQRKDIDVSTTTVFDTPCTVIIEVKWSDNKDDKKNVSTGLMEQLGECYLRGTGETHGIFVVGWNGRLGKWRTRANPRPKENSATALAERLAEQAKTYNQKFPSIHIRSLVIDLTWPADQPNR